MSLLKQLFEGQAIAPELVEKIETLFEAAVGEKVKAQVAEATEALRADHKTLLEAEVKVQTDLLQEAHNTKMAELTQLVESTLQTGVLEWADANKVELDGKLKIQLAESFIQATAGVLVEHSVQVPDDSAALMNEQAARIEELDQSLAKALTEGQNAVAELQKLQRVAALNEATKNLTDTQRERVALLMEGVEFGSADIFGRKVGVLVEAVVDPDGAAAKQRALNEQAQQAALDEEAAKQKALREAEEAAQANKGDGLLVENQNQAPAQPAPAVDPSVAAYVAAL